MDKDKAVNESKQALVGRSRARWSDSLVFLADQLTLPDLNRLLFSAEKTIGSIDVPVIMPLEKEVDTSYPDLGRHLVRQDGGLQVCHE